MDDALIFLQGEMAALDAISEKIMREMPQRTEGTLRVSTSNGSPRYFVKQDGEELYLPKKQRERAARLAKRDYLLSMLKRVEKRRKAYEKAIACLEEGSLQDVYDKMCEGRKRLVKSLIESDEDFLERWNAENLGERNTYQISDEYITSRGEKVRSKSELLIANRLADFDIPYKYECPLEISGYTTFFPDFTALNKRTRKTWRWEHFGMMTNPEYAENTIQKLSLYEKTGLYIGDGLIVTFEASGRGIVMGEVDDYIKKYLL